MKFSKVRYGISTIVAVGLIEILRVEIRLANLEGLKMLDSAELSALRKIGTKTVDYLRMLTP